MKCFQCANRRDFTINILFSWNIPQLFAAMRPYSTPGETPQEDRIPAVIITVKVLTQAIDNAQASCIDEVGIAQRGNPLLD